MIVKPNELKFDDKKIVMIVAGVPGIGKTTFALSSPDPLLVDLDNGISRVEARYRKDTIVVKSFGELENDLTKSDLSPYKTIVIDTGGKLLEMLKPVVIAKDPKNGKKDGNLSLQGYGAVKREFARFINFVKSLDKHLIIIFHATEVNLENDTTGLRIRMEGSSRDDVWDDVDIGGFIEMNGKKRTIGFSNCDRYYAKGTHGIHGVYEIPTLESGSKNNFLTNMFNKIKDDLNAETEELDNYTKVMASLMPSINNAVTVDDVNLAYGEIVSAKHYLTSKEELGYALMEKAKELGFKYVRESNKFE